MPTPLRNLRVEDELWEAALEVARKHGENLSDVMREALTLYVTAHRK